MPPSGALLTLRRQGLATPAERVSIDGWTLHSGATYALTHHFTGREGSAFDEYVRLANDLLFNTELAIERIERESDPDDGEGTAAEAARVAIERADPSIAEKAGQFRSRDATLEAWLTPE